MTTISPLAKLCAAGILGVVLLLSLDPVSAVVALVFELSLLPWAGVPARRLLRILTPLLIAAPFAGLATLLYGRDGGAVLVQIGPWTITSAEVELAIAITLRVLAVALPAVVLFATTDPTDLADGLAQLWKLPARFVIGALAAIRMLGQMRQDWQMLRLARRARGIADGGGPIAALGRLGNQAMALLTIAVRRGSLLATAMEARAFDAPVQRTWARVATFTPRDAWFVVGAAVIAIIAVMMSVMTGAWNFVIS
ncbi:energy-coupling factor transporter transmembrane component T family protein [Aurantimicrobium minutum]|jgi:energy-coupling factor transport system permease protein|uniref:energy-coupling factor transporter transmembrane component T family protein n=1 Tax=Aurantimicrobium minutum TaxID=708131 RepID=UPI0024771E6B|nr:energy-coupling factor transporter transmembrane component T [Aurantimicrobium minutum]MDH6206908.1 energy-coupling factor transport system permease protein [Aurantimicrobium minutum]MDH6255641.1 energy-coupling factor transport system permease protein [Aurantimicrobium minutum]MDH6410151.1 energy-coupling factor transport system permease protein [Aurantimicrobium minutum]MDH6536356.1 energy-coupling factor transport system permease protein [Aurantimicrobium minutum]